MHVTETVGPSRRERLLGRWKYKVKEYMNKRGVGRKKRLEQAKRECLDREKWRLFCHGYPLGGRSHSEASEFS